MKIKKHLVLEAVLSFLIKYITFVTVNIDGVPLNDTGSEREVRIIPIPTTNDNKIKLILFGNQNFIKTI